MFWRLWFYILIALPIIVCFPFLLLFSSREQWYPYFFWIARNFWAKTILYGMGFYPRITEEQQLDKGKSYMLIANHSSMTDIMLMLVASKNPFVFVGKKELAKFPLFGFFYKRVCIMVDRSSARSRSAVYLRAKKRLDSGLSICIFPEGGVPDDEDILLDTFKDGAFRLAIEYGIPIVPMSFLDNKRRFSYRFFSGSMGRMRVYIHRFFETAHLDSKDKEELKNEVRFVLLKKLQKTNKT